MKTTLIALALSGCSVVTTGIAVTSTAVSVGSAVVSTAVTVGSAAVRGAVKVGETVIDAATAPAADETPAPKVAQEVAVPPPSAQAQPIEMPAPLDQRELPNNPPSAANPCCSN